MRVTRESILAAHKTVARAVNKKSTLPVLCMVKLNYTGGVLSLESTNLEQRIEVTMPAAGDDNLAICLPCDDLGNVLQRMTSEELVIKQQGDVSVTVLGDRSRATLKGVSSDEFPPSRPTGTPLCQIPVDSLLAALRWVSTSVAEDPSRPTLTGILVIAKDGIVTFAATDGYRLATYRVDGIQSEPYKFIFPGSAAKMLSTILMAGDDQVTVSGYETSSEVGSNIYMTNGLIFKAGNLTLSTALIEAQYPNYEKIMPKTHDLRCVVSPKDLAAALKLAQTYAKDSASIVRLTFNGHLDVHAESAEIGMSDSEVTIIERNGDEAELMVALNYEMLSAILSIMPGPMAIELVRNEKGGQSNRPVAIRPLGMEHAYYLQMPMSTTR